MPHMDDSEGGQHVALGSENRHILPAAVAITSVLTTDCGGCSCPLNWPTLFHLHYIFDTKCYAVVTSLSTGCDWRTAARTAARERIKG